MVRLTLEESRKSTICETFSGLKGIRAENAAFDSLFEADSNETLAQQDLTFGR